MFIKIYKTDDSVMSEPPEITNAVSFTLRSDLNQVGGPIKLIAKADSGYLVNKERENKVAQQLLEKLAKR